MKISILLYFLINGFYLIATAGGEEDVTPLTSSEYIVSLYRKNLNGLVKRLNKNIEPCDDFFEHICGRPPPERSDETVKRIESSTDDDENEVPAFLYNVEDRMAFFEENRQNFGTKAGQVLNNLYNECKQRRQKFMLYGNAQSQWQRMLHEIQFLTQDANIYEKGPFLHYQWEVLSEKFDLNWLTLAAVFAAHGISSFFEIFFAEQTIFVAPLNDLKCPTLDAIKENINIDFLQAKYPQKSAVIASELWSFCRKLSNEINLSSEALNSSNNPLLDDTIAAYFQTYFSMLNFSQKEVSEARKVAVNQERLSEILTLLQTTEPRILFNFIIWHAHENVKYEDCFALTTEFEDILHSEYFHWHVFEKYANRDLLLAKYVFYTKLFQKQRKKVLLSEDWEKFLSVQLTRRDLNIERLLRTYGNVILSEEKLTTTYELEKTQFLTHKFYENLLELRRLRLRNTFYAPYIDEEDVNHASYFLRHFLYFSIMTLKQPPFHYFATIGRQLWQESNLLYSSDGYYTALDCLERQTQLYLERSVEEEEEGVTTANDDSIFHILTANEIEQIFRFYTAFTASYNDYHFWLKGESFAFTENFMLEYYKMDTERLMFYAVAQLYCDRNDAVYRTQINRSFMNIPQFQEAFNCSSTAPMNPVVKCMIKNCK